MSSYPQNHLLQLVDAHDLAALSEFFSLTLPQLPIETQASYTALLALQSPVSAPALLLIAATRAEAPDVFKLLWDSLYNCVEVGGQPAPANSTVLSGSAAPLQIPYPCLQHAARLGSTSLARVFLNCDPSALARGPPPAMHGRASGSQILTALWHKNFAYIDFIREQGIALDHEWPRVKILRVASGIDQSDEELEAMLRWLVQRGARISGAGALRLLAQHGTVNAVRILLEAGADVEDLEDEDEENKPVDSAIMEASRAGNLDIVKLLVEHGADVNQENSKGETILSVAELKNKDDISAALKSFKR